MKVFKNIINFLEESIDGKLTTNDQVKFLSSFKITDPEILTEVVNFLMEKSAMQPELPEAIDFCGTGGSGLPRMNISTPTSILLATGGVKVAKHGNRASSGRFGSFDLLEKLGVEFQSNKEKDQEVFHRSGLTFLFAQKLHPVMKNFAAARKKYGKPTFFNLLGPLLNPSKPEKQFIGTAFPENAELIIKCCKLLGKKHVFVVHGSDGLDKATITGSSTILELKNGKITKYKITPEDFGIKRVDFKDISGSPEENPQYINNFIKGKLDENRTNLICLNAAFGFVLAGKSNSLLEGFKLAKEISSSNKLDIFFQNFKHLCSTPSILLKIIESKRKTVNFKKEKIKLPLTIQKSDRSFKDSISKKDKINLIAEIKPASPSEGDIKSPKISVSHRARIYENEGASAISILTDKEFFKGSLNNLSSAREATKKIPLLCKDFIIDEYQIREARLAGADAILLIAAILNKEQIDEFIRIAKQYDMDALCEVHNQKELDKVLSTKAEIIGINNRDLNTFSVDLNTTASLINQIPNDIITVSESGIHTKTDIEKIPKRTNAVLVGTSIMKSKNIPHIIHQLTNQKPQLKICGIQSIDEIKICEENNVSLIGFNFVPSSKRYIDPQQMQI